MKLMTTQLQNQDPFAPMENAEFIAQMAQFSTVTGITEMGQTLKGLSSQLSEFRIATATNMLGNSVLVPGTKAYPDSEGAVHGVVDLPAASGATNVVFKSMQGEILHVEDLGAQASGLTVLNGKISHKKFWMRTNILPLKPLLTMAMVWKVHRHRYFLKCWLLQLAVQMAFNWMSAAMGISVPVTLFAFAKVLAHKLL